MSVEGLGRVVMAGHVVVGGGHFVEVGGRLIQECFIHGPQIQTVFDSIVRANETLPALGNVLVGSRPAPINNIYTAAPPILLTSDQESRAWEAYQRAEIDERFYRSLDTMKEAGLAVGSIWAGDYQSALEHGAAAAELWWKDLSGAWQSAENFGTQPLSPNRD